MQKSIVILASVFARVMCLGHNDVAANVSAEVSDAKQQPRDAMVLQVQVNDTLQNSISTATYKARNSVVREIKLHTFDVNRTLPTDTSLATVKQEAAPTVKPKSRNGMVRVSTAAPASQTPSLQDPGSASADTTVHMGMFREGGALICLAILVLWLTRKSLWAMWEEVVDPHKQAQKYEASLEPSMPKTKKLTAYDFGCANDVSETFAQNTDCFQRRLDQVLKTHRIPVPSNSPRNEMPTL